MANRISILPPSQFISESRLSGLGDWIFNKAYYEDWYEASSSSLLLLHGIASSRKTHTCSVVVDSLLANAAVHPSAALFAYFYCSSLEFERGRSSLDEVMRTILRQLATDRIDSKKVRDFLWSDYERRLATASIDGFDPPELRTKDSVELILELADQEPLTIVVIDDIDHTHEDDCHTFIEPLNRIIARSSNVVKILVTSRDNAHISTALTAADKTIRITSDEVRQDIETFVNHQIDGAIVKGWLFGNVSPTLRSMVQQALLGGAGEM